MTRLADLVATSAAVAATSSRTAKGDALAGFLARLAPEEVPIAVGFLVGSPRQGRTGIGWRTLQAAATPPAATATLEVGDLDEALDAVAALSGPGSATARRERLRALLARATAAEQTFVHRLLGGELRQGASAGVMVDAVARSAGVPAPLVRRATMLGGDLATIAGVALTSGAAGLAAVGLAVGRPVQPMLASTAATVADAVDDLGDCIVDWKLDGIRIQVHRHGDEVRVWTRNLNEVTARLPEVVELVGGLPATDLVLDGEALVVDGAQRPVPFQDTASRVSATGPAADSPGGGARPAVQPWFFDLLHRDGVDLVDVPLHERRQALLAVAGPATIPATRTSDLDEADAVLRAALAAGHEGVVVKDASSPYEAGRRGRAWRKVKPVHTLDLVVLAAEWGHGRRQGWLSNLHLGARDGDGFAMVGKTFKGMTDDVLRWQTEALLAVAVEPAEADPGAVGGVVGVRPELVVEVAVDGAQRSTRYPGGVALRFARVVRYRPDKDADGADTIATVRALRDRA